MNNVISFINKIKFMNSCMNSVFMNPKFHDLLMNHTMSFMNCSYGFINYSLTDHEQCNIILEPNEVHEYILEFSINELTFNSS